MRKCKGLELLQIPSRKIDHLRQLLDVSYGEMTQLDRED